QVLQVVAHEGDIEMRRRDQVGESEPVSLHEPDVLAEVSRHVAKVGRPLLARPNATDEMAAVARDIENHRARVDEPLQVAGDLFPEGLLRGFGGVVEAPAVHRIERALYLHRRRSLSSPLVATVQKSFATMRFGTGEPSFDELFRSGQLSHRRLRISKSACRNSAARPEPGRLAVCGFISM